MRGLYRVLCVYTLYLAIAMPTRKSMPNCPPSAILSILNAKLSRTRTHNAPYAHLMRAGTHGMPPHGGFAIGLERITACFLGIANVKECSMFPSDINRVAP